MRLEAPGGAWRLLEAPGCVWRRLGAPGSAGARLGAPLAELRLGAADSTRTRAVLIYPAAPDEPTGLYLYLHGGRVDSVRGDEFNGFEGNSALHWFHTP